MARKMTLNSILTHRACDSLRVSSFRIHPSQPFVKRRTWCTTNTTTYPQAHSGIVNGGTTTTTTTTITNRTMTTTGRMNSGEKSSPIQSLHSQEEENAQRRAYAHYQRYGQREKRQHEETQSVRRDRNTQIAMYAAAAVIGALGATYASVPLYKIFCQATGFGGTTQRVQWSSIPSLKEKEESEKANVNPVGDGMEKESKSSGSKVSQELWDKLLSLSNLPLEMLPSSSSRSYSHGGSRGGGAKTWTDEEAMARLASLKPVSDGRLVTIRFDSTVGDVLPWSFRPTQLDVKVVPGETALSFFTATNHSNQAITGVATYNVHPPRAGLYFNKVQCFCFEEQRLLPGETVDMPVFFFIDPEYVNDPQLAKVNNITLSYTFFQTDIDHEDDIAEDTGR